MGAVLSRGTTQLRGWLLSYLQAALPPMVEQAWSDWGIEPWQLPKPKKYDTYDLPMTDFNGYPVIGADFSNETNHVRTDFTDRAEPEYWSNQQGSVYVWAATARDEADKLETPCRDSCMRVRDDLAELVRQALLVLPSLGQGPDTCWLEESTLNVNRMDPFKAGENRPDYIVGTLIPVVYRVKSELCIVPYGTADTIDFTARKLED